MCTILGKKVQIIEVEKHEKKKGNKVTGNYKYFFSAPIMRVLSEENGI